MNINGPAIEILQARKSGIKTVNDVYELLKAYFQMVDKFRKLESIRQERQDEESVQVLGAKVRALCDASFTPETRESRAIKYFVDALLLIAVKSSILVGFLVGLLQMVDLRVGYHIVSTNFKPS